MLILPSLLTSMMSKKADYGEVNEKKVANEEDLPVKKKHTTGEGCSLFPIYTWLFYVYIVTAITLAIFLIINGSWANTGYFSFQAIINQPWPNLQVEDEDHHAMALEFLQLSCWICGFFFWLFAIYLIYVIYVYFTLLWVVRPWDRQDWNEVRVAANHVLAAYDKRFDRMNKKQQEEMSKYKRPQVKPVDV